MTTKFRIIFGFTLMVLLMGIVAAIGYQSNSSSSEGFTHYRRIARFDSTLSNLQIHLLTMETGLYRFAYHGEAQGMVDSRKEMTAIETLLKTSDEYVRLPERKAKLAEIGKLAQTIKENQNAVQTHTQDFNSLYTSVIQPNEERLMAQLDKIGALLTESGDISTLTTINLVWDNFSKLSADLRGLSRSFSANDAKMARERTASIAKSIEELKKILLTDAGKALFAELVPMFATFKTSVETLDAKSAALRGSLDTITANISTIDSIALNLNNELTDERNQVGPALVERHENSQKLILTVGTIGLLLGALLAAYSIITLIRVLNELSGFARGVAAGDFDRTIKVKEKGEIQAVVQAVQQIPVVLKQMIEQGNDLAGQIMVGQLRNRLDPKVFPGAFAGLATATNSLADAYTHVIDALPVPVMGCDKNIKIVFLNKIAQTALGGNYTATGCADNLKAKECSSDCCLGRQTMGRNAPVTAETTIHPMGRRMDVSVTALPLHDSKGQVAGFFEIITDLTEVKQKQATMLQVARDASDISNRVAAASEQLATQVEQISRGAEMQRSRVESTASAMTEMNSTVLEVARSASQASEQSERTREKADAGAGLVNQVVHSINMVNSVAMTLQNNMQELGSQAESIGGVMNVISDIADQTNLLALNAAIEAARAGEAGRGFAVVADEVRKLAEKTMSATHEVGASIKAIQQSTRTNIDEVSTAVKSITEATTLANSSGTALGEIVQLASANSSVVASIATAAEEQSATSEEISHAIEEINKVVGETTEGMIQSSSAVQELSRMTHDLNKVMEALK